MKHTSLLFALLFTFLISVNAQTILSPLKTTEEINRLFIQNKPEEVFPFLSPSVAGKLTAPTLKTMWEQLQSQFGRLTRIYDVKLENNEAKIIYTSVYAFDNMELQLRISLNDSSKITIDVIYDDKMNVKSSRIVSQSRF